MMEANIGIIIGGITLYKAVSVGPPVIVINTNHGSAQSLPASEFERRVYGINLTIPDRKGQEEICDAFSMLFHDKELRAEFTKCGKELVGGKGVIGVANFVERVLEEVERKC